MTRSIRLSLFLVSDIDHRDFSTGCGEAGPG